MTNFRKLRKQHIVYKNQSVLKAFHAYFGGDTIFDLVDFKPGTIVIYLQFSES